MTCTRVYIAGPITIGDQWINVRQAIRAAEILHRAGFVPFVPHLDCLWHFLYPGAPEKWLTWDFEWLVLCHAVYRLPGDSKGADMETARARKSGIPVFTAIGDLVEWREQRVKKMEEKEKPWASGPGCAAPPRC
jgi:hypothetical protein